MINAKTLRIALKVKANRSAIIEKLDKGINVKGFVADEKQNKKDKQFLLDWKNKTKQEQLNWCEQQLNSESFESGFSYAYSKKEDIKENIKSSPGKMKDKIKRGIDSAFKKNG